MSTRISKPAAINLAIVGSLLLGGMAFNRWPWIAYLLLAPAVLIVGGFILLSACAALYRSYFWMRDDSAKFIRRLLK